MNTILTDQKREYYKPVIDELFAICPEVMCRKIPRANVQQAFVLDFVRGVSSKTSKILSVGSFEDTASLALVRSGYSVTEIDPAVNVSLDEFFKKTKEKYDVILSTSVIEHVEHDELFIDQICKLLGSEGYGVLTCDFNDTYIMGSGKPVEDYRLYTEKDLTQRLASVLTKNNCSLFGDIDYDYPVDFQYGGFTYGFATFVFKKNQ